MNSDEIAAEGIALVSHDESAWPKRRNPDTEITDDASSPLSKTRKFLDRKQYISNTTKTVPRRARLHSTVHEQGKYSPLLYI